MAVAATMMKPFSSFIGLQIRRKNVLEISRRKVASYEGYGKATIDIENKTTTEEDFVPLISTYSQLGFRLNNKTFVMGPMIIFKKHVLFWNIRGDEAINEKSLEVFFHFEPPLDLLIVGYGDNMNTRNLSKDIYGTCIKRGVPLELLPSAKACTLYNIVAQDRNVAAALIPPRKIHFNINDIYRTRQRYGIEDGREIIDTNDELVENAHDVGMRLDKKMYRNLLPLKDRE